MVYNSKEGRLFLLDGGKEDLVVINSKAGRLPVFLDSFDSVGMEDDGGPSRKHKCAAKSLGRTGTGTESCICASWLQLSGVPSPSAPELGDPSRPHEEPSPPRGCGARSPCNGGIGTGTCTQASWRRGFAARPPNAPGCGDPSRPWQIPRPPVQCHSTVKAGCPWR